MLVRLLSRGTGSRVVKVCSWLLIQSRGWKTKENGNIVGISIALAFSLKILSISF